MIAIEAATEWMIQGQCTREGDPDDWHPEGDDRSATILAGKAARKICGRCPVRQTCLDHALERDEREGIWGGTSAYERAKMRGPNETKPATMSYQRGQSPAETVALLRHLGLNESRPIKPQLRTLAAEIGVAFSTIQHAWYRRNHRPATKSKRTAA